MRSKKRIVFVGIVLSVLCLAACEGSQIKNYEYEVYYVRNSLRSDDEVYPSANIFRSLEEWEDFYKEYPDGAQIVPVNTKELNKVCKQYDEAYFEEHDLIVLMIDETSGSNSLEMKKVYYDKKNGQWQLTVKRHMAKGGSDDMVMWNILVELDAGKVIEEGEEVEVILE